uniref:FAS1 domain-containing protein n=1 Tax=Onchocerca volvulus TaxID=6282 RepID=A0A8R1XS49_ONCVO
MVLNSFAYLIFGLIPIYEAQSYVQWNGDINEDSGIRPFETLLSKLFTITRNLYTIDDSITSEEQLKVREDYNTIASEAKEFLEHMTSFLGNDDKENINREFRKGRPTFHKETFTIEQHVCVREKKVPLLWKISESACTSHKRAMRCIKGDDNGTLIRIVECCDGYYTTDIKKGCIPYDTPKNLDELLNGKNVCTNGLELKNTKFTTLLIANNESCPTNDTDNRDWDEYILEQPYRSYELLNSQKLPTRKPGVFVIVSTNSKRTGLDDKPLLNCIKIAEEDLEWRNGTVQLLIAPLPQATNQTLLDIIANDSDLSAFNSLLTDDLRKRLASNSLISTVFVFNNEIFASLSQSFQARLRQKKGCARELIKEHIYDGMLCSVLMEDDIKSITGIKHRFYKLRNVNNTELIRLDNGRVLDTDRVASNGVIHMIDDVILAEQSAVDWRDHLEFPEREFLEIVERNIGYENEPVAIFIPPSDSFRNLTDEKSFVLNHIAINDSHITNKLIETAYGSKIPSSMRSRRPVFGCASTVKPPIKYCNTTIYSIDAPLKRTMNTLQELITVRDDFSVFASLLNDSNVDLENKGLYTVFLPSNDALSNNQIRALKMNKTLSSDFVRTHIFDGLLCSKNFRIGMSHEGLPIILKNFRGEYYHSSMIDKTKTFGDIDLQIKKMMGRILLKSNRQSTHHTSTLRKINDGGVSKQLTAAEKRKRMIEAGTKYAEQNRKIKADCSAGSHFMKFSVKTVPGSTIKTQPCKKSMVRQHILQRRNNQIVDTFSNQQSISRIIRNHSDAKSKPKSYFVKTPLKPINETFERDDAALTSILSRCPQNSISGRASIFRGRERPSLFPNGVNPLDRAAVKFAKPLPLTAFATRSFSLGAISSAKVDTTSTLITPSLAVKISKRTPMKTVRFDESIDFRSPKIDISSPETSVPKIDEPASLETTDEMILNLKLKFDDMLEKLRNLPAHVFSNLEEAVHQITSEKSTNASKICDRHPFNSSLNSTAVSFLEPEMKEILPSYYWSAVQITPPMDCIASRTRRKIRLSQVYANVNQVILFNIFLNFVKLK